MSKELVHTGRISWWNGRGYALCGVVAENVQRAWFSKTTCPACLAAKKK